ncbi:tryptophan synthase subunit alpha [Catellatospora bangladeshensis]|uniref:Tryptophan synthase alpha chain n=1 Tax=Catellatospora bangladeshensis TaxID=310355 RepID=A0A8J3JNX6_9ACTN|nr:tryptophan synthase subunit alpha [Catellatospora bangladeshensis]GIF82173.1 tryptophan synthase alpha chain [Catellatospora bangladeshensis]
MTTPTVTGVPVETHLRARRDAGRKLLVPYVTAGVCDDWTAHLRACAEAGADAIEIGLPFSEPTVDGPTVQEASDRALHRGTSLRILLADLRTVRVDVPLIVMTYYHLVAREGLAAVCAALAEAGVRGLIVPDLPLDESAGLEQAAAGAGIDLILVAAPSSSPARLREIAQRSRGFVYAVTAMATTGERTALPATAGAYAATLKQHTDLPVLLGFGISTPDHAAAGARSADGVVVGSALMRRILDGATPADTAAFVTSLRTTLDT